MPRTAAALTAAVSSTDALLSESGKAGAAGRRLPDCARFKGSDDLETFRARLHDLPEVSIQSRLALKYSDSILNPEEPIKEGYYHGFGKICFYFENMDE